MSQNVAEDGQMLTVVVFERSLITILGGYVLCRMTSITLLHQAVHHHQCTVTVQLYTTALGSLWAPSLVQAVQAEHPGVSFYNYKNAKITSIFDCSTATD